MSDPDMGVIVRTQYPSHLTFSVYENNQLRGSVVMTLDEAEAWARDLIKVCRLRRKHLTEVNGERA